MADNTGKFDTADGLRIQMRSVQKSGIDSGVVIIDRGGSGTEDLGPPWPNGAQVDATLTRPADTTAYAADDEVASSTSAPTILTFSNMARVSGGSGLIIGATMRDSAYSATEGAFELWLFDTTHTPDNDNAAFTPTDGEMDNLIGGGPIQFYYKVNGDKTAGATGNMLYIASGGPWPFLTVGSANLFGRVVVRNAYTPISAETFRFRLHVRQN